MMEPSHIWSLVGGMGRGKLDGTTIAIAIVLGLVIFTGFAVADVLKATKPDSLLTTSQVIVMSPSIDHVDVGVIRVALDGRVRGRVQDELDRIRAAHDRTTPLGRSATLREATKLLRHLYESWRYGGIVDEPIRHFHDARAVYEAHYARCCAELASLPTSPLDDPRPDVVLVTIVVATRGPLVDVMYMGEGDGLRRALEAASYRDPADIVGIEILWHPTTADYRLPREVVESMLPASTLVRLTRSPNLGSPHCGLCGEPWPTAELRSCPHCGRLADAA